jgi:hypothetical protein
MQFILFDYTNNNEVLTDPKIYGPVENYSSDNIVEEIVLNLSPDEEIYLIQGVFKNKKITRLEILTTYGQYVEFGENDKQVLFSWHYYFNLHTFNGFIIGWDNTNITYLTSLCILKDFIDEKQITLTDTKYDSSMLNIDPVYLSQRFGEITKSTSLRDDLINLNIYDGVKQGDVYISEIVCYYNIFINSLEIEYTNKCTMDRFRSAHSCQTSKNI